MAGDCVNKLPVIGIILGDHAGIGPEITAMALSERPDMDFAAVLVGNYELFARAMMVVPGSAKLQITHTSARPGAPGVYFADIPADGDIPFGEVNAHSGRLIFDSMQSMLKLERAGIVDGFIMGPITKQALGAAGLNYSSEFEIFAEFYKSAGVRAVVKAGMIFRCTVVGHVRFSEIACKLTTQGVVDTARALICVMRRFMVSEHIKIAVAALNPHAGEDGLFGDEETTVLAPAIDILRAEGVNAIGPCPADTVYRRAQTGKVGGIVYLYHDQGNIAMKAASFGDGVLIYVNVPANIVSVGHGGAFGSAGKGTASPRNMMACIDTLLGMIREDM